MKPILNTIAVLLIIAGGVWFLQGINLLPGSFMTGQIQWAIYDGISILAGIGLCFFIRLFRLCCLFYGRREPSYR